MEQKIQFVLSVNVAFAGHLSHFNSARFDNPC